jgi:hypothetical protein
MLFRVRRDLLVHAARPIRPPTVRRKYLRKPDEAYMLSPGGPLMPAKKDQAQPGLNYFTQSRK